MSKLRKNRKGSSKRYNMSIIDSPKIAQKRSMRQANIWSSPTNSRPKRAKLDPILNQSLVRQFKEEEKDENLESLMSKLNIQDCTSPKQHDQNDKAQVVVDCNDAVIETEREQESHTRIRLTHQEISTKIADFVNSKLKAKDIWKLCPDIHRSTIYNHFNRINEKGTNSRKISRVKDGSNTQIIEDAIRQILIQNEMFNSKDIQKELESNHKIVLSDSSITKKLKDMGYSYSALTPWLKLSKSQMEAREKWAKESSVVNWNNAVYIDEAAFYGGDFTQKMGICKWRVFSQKNKS